MNREGHLTKRLLISKGERWVVWISTPGSVLNRQYNYALRLQMAHQRRDTLGKALTSSSMIHMT